MSKIVNIINELKEYTKPIKIDFDAELKIYADNYTLIKSALFNTTSDFIHKVTDEYKKIFFLYSNRDITNDKFSIVVYLNDKDNNNIRIIGRDTKHIFSVDGTTPAIEILFKRNYDDSIIFGYHFYNIDYSTDGNIQKLELFKKTITLLESLLESVADNIKSKFKLNTF